MAEDKKRTYQSATLGVPALKMVLVHARNEAQNAALRPVASPAEAASAEQTLLEKEQAVRRIIEHLKESR